MGASPKTPTVMASPIMSVLPYILDLNSYLKFDDTSLTKLLSICQNSCCGTGRIRWGYYRRTVRTETYSVVIKVPRMYCKICKKTGSFLPPFVFRYGRWYLDVLVDPILELCTKGTSLLQAWSQRLVAALDYKTFTRHLHMIAFFAENIHDRFVSFLRRIEPTFQIEALDKRDNIFSGRWFFLGECVVIIKAFNEYRQLNGFKTVSVLGVVHALATPDTILVV
ncbi:hypothetical protein ACFL27_25590 [candidate division CSSED10-310 bacterium]|uniref:Transposase family protein n=1 Tax=candidate division CSSED10-310 bacterium TaxID=2855610 RepID=A0ABV6Z575_UNCC1